MDDIDVAAPRPPLKVWMPRRTVLECIGDVRADGMDMLTNRLYDLGCLFDVHVYWPWEDEELDEKLTEHLEHLLPGITFERRPTLQGFRPDLVFDEDKGHWGVPVIKLSTPRLKQGPTMDLDEHWSLTEFYATSRELTRMIGRRLGDYWCQAVRISLGSKHEVWWQCSVWKQGRKEPVMWEKANCIHAACSLMEAAVLQAQHISRGVSPTTV